MRRAILAVAALVFSASQAAAQCAPTVAVYEALTNRHGETRVVTGLTPEGVLVEIWGNQRNGTWTLIATDAQGNSCLIAAGDAMVSIPTGVPG